MDMTKDPVGPTLRGLAVPMMWGMASMFLVNLADSFFVGQLGAEELAAVAFTFPAVFLMIGVSFGIGAGASAVVARAAGEGNRERVARLATDAMLLVLVVMSVASVIGFLNIDALFGILGAEEALLPLIRDYMQIYYATFILVVIPMTGNNILRSVGDAKTPARIMMMIAAVNAVLDPLLIFGIGPFPRMELQGAALATAIAFSVGLFAALRVFIVREKLLRAPTRETFQSWKSILHIGIPAMFTSLLTPLATTFLTWLAAQQSTETVAALGVAGRIEGLGMIGINAMGASLTPFMGQNLGASAHLRIRAAQRYAFDFAFKWGSTLAVIVGLTAPWIASAFTKDPVVQEQIQWLLWLVPVTYYANGWLGLAANAASGLGEARDATYLNGFRALALVPCAFLGAWLGGAFGLVIGIAFGNLLSGFLGHGLLTLRVRQFDAQNDETAPATD